MNEQELDLSNPETIKRLKELDVTKTKPDVETEEIENAIKSVGRLQKFTIKLTAAESVQLLREASTLGKDPKEYLQELVTERCFDTRVGTPLISRCSHHTATVVGPSGSGQVKRG